MALTALSRALQDVTITFVVLTFLFVALRVYTRIRQIRQKKDVLHRPALLWSDITIVISFLIFIPYCGIIFQALRVPSGSIELADLLKTPSTVLYYVDILSVNTLLMTIILAVSKISILLFYREIFVSKPFQKLNAATIGLVVAWCIAFLLLVVLRCNPPSATWIIDEQFEPTTTCVDYGVVIFALEMTNLLTDILILALPLNELRKLQMRASKKVGIAMLFCLGAFVVFTCAIIISFTWGKKLVPFSLSFIWITVQLGCQIIGSCIPTLAPLVPEGFVHYVEMLSNSIRSTASRISTRKTTTTATKRSNENLSSDARRQSTWYSKMNSPIDLEAANRDKSWYDKTNNSSSLTTVEAIKLGDVPSPVGVPEDAIGVQRVVHVTSSAHSNHK